MWFSLLLLCLTRIIFESNRGMSAQVLLLLLDNADECLENRPEAFRQTVRAPMHGQSLFLLSHPLMFVCS